MMTHSALARLFALCVSVELLCHVGQASAAVSANREPKVVAISQTVSSPASGSQSKITVSVGMAGQLRGALAMRKGGLQLSDQGASAFGGLPVVDYSSMTKTVCSPSAGGGRNDYSNDFMQMNGDEGNCVTVGLSESEVIAAADAYIASASPALIASLQTMMKDNGAVTGIYTFEQELGNDQLAGRQRLVWSVVVDPSGGVRYGKSKLVSATQVYLYVTYTPRAVASGLPQSWQYTNPGILTWVLVDLKMRALAAPTSVDTGGYFDEPDGDVGSEAMLKCLIDRTSSGCTSTFPDVVTLLAQTGATGAFVDYLHAVSPIYDNVEAPPGSGQYVSVAELNLQVPTRQLDTSFDPTCLIKTYTYTNSGAYQFNLSHAMTRYFVDKGKAGYSAISHPAMAVLSPWQNYGMSMTVDAGSLPALPGLYIDPFMQAGPLLGVGGLPAASSLATVNYTPAPVCIPVVPPAPPSGP